MKMLKHDHYSINRIPMYMYPKHLFLATMCHAMVSSKKIDMHHYKYMFILTSFRVTRDFHTYCRVEFRIMLIN